MEAIVRTPSKRNAVATNRDVLVAFDQQSATAVRDRLADRPPRNLTLDRFDGVFVRVGVDVRRLSF